MPLARDDFVRQLTSSGVMAAEEVEQFLASFPADQQPADAEQLGRALVEQRKLTKYQVNQLCAGKPLVLGNYIIIDKLGQGGMGIVLKAEHKRMKRLVALKVLSSAALRSPDAVKRFHREVEAGARLMHPNIVVAHDADVVDGTYFLVMEFVNGIDLSSLVKKLGPLPVEHAVNCIIQAARGLELAHEQGVIHRDIKPANLLVDRKGTVKILDLGLALIEKGSSPGARLTVAGTIMGTADYMSPEQATDAKRVDARSDIYSLGCSLYFLLIGRTMYGGTTMLEKLKSHQNAPIPSLEGIRDGQRFKDSQGPEDSNARSQISNLNLVFQRMVAKRPEDRLQTMTKVIAELERCFSGILPMVVIDVAGGNEVQPSLRQQRGEASTFLSESNGTAEIQSSADADTNCPPRA